MSKWKVWLGITVIFLSGIVIGGIGTAVIAKKRVEHWRNGDADKTAELAFKRLDRTLRFTGEQEEKIEPLILNAHKTLHQLRKEMRTQAVTIIREGAEKVSIHLTSEQNEKFKNTLQNLRKKATLD